MWASPAAWAGSPASSGWSVPPVGIASGSTLSANWLTTRLAAPPPRMEHTGTVPALEHRFVTVPLVRAGDGLVG
jgi:hypothetical protein